MTFQDCIITGLPLARIPQPVRAFFAETRRKQRLEDARAKRRQEVMREATIKKLLAIEKLKSFVRDNGSFRLDANGQLIARCFECYEVKPIMRFAWKGHAFRSHCRACENKLR